MIDETSEIRRPGVNALAAKLLKENPNWDVNRAMAEAKTRILHRDARTPIQAKKVHP